MMEAEFRFHEFEFRAGTDDGPGMLTGPVVVYGDEAIGRKGRERTEPGFFQNVSDTRIRAVVQHERSQPLAANGRGLTLRDSQRMLVAELKLPKTTRGYETREYIQEGVYTGYSSKFYPRRETRDTMRVLQQGLLEHVAVVDHPAYGKSTFELRAEDFLAEFEGRSRIPAAGV